MLTPIPLAHSCFACARPISSFGPAWESSRGQGAMLSALRSALQTNSSARTPPRSTPRATAPAFVPQLPPQPQPARHQPYPSGPAPAGYYVHPLTGQTLYYAPPPPPSWAPPTSSAMYPGLPPVFTQPFDPYNQHSAYHPLQPSYHPPTTQSQYYQPPTTPPRATATIRTPKMSPSTPRGHGRESTGGTIGTPELTRDAFSPARRLDWAAETMTPPQNAPVEPVWTSSLGCVLPFPRPVRRI